MPIQIYLAALAVAASIPVLWLSVAADRSSSGKSIFRRRSEQGESLPGADLRAIALDQGAGERVIKPALSGIADLVRRFTPGGSLRRIEQRIDKAGLQAEWPVEKVLAAKLAMVLGLGLGAYLLAGPLYGLALGALGFFIPDLLLDSRARERQERIRLELPDVLDQMTMSVEAGLGFEAALARAAMAGEGPLAHELQRVVHEMQLGATRTEALRNLGERSDVRDLQTFVSAVVQSEEYGLPIAHTLRIQSEELRIKRRQRAEEEAMKIPVKIIFPLVMCIFPTMFIVLLGPAVISIFDNIIRR